MGLRTAAMVGAVAGMVGAIAASGIACGGHPRTESAVVITLPSLTLLSATAFVAQDFGLFEAEGLDVTIRHVVGVGAVNAVLAGSADFTIGTGATFLRAISQGQRFVAIANMVDRPMVEFVVRTDLAQRVGFEDRLLLPERGRRLKGLTIGIQGVGSMVHAWVRYVASVGGLNVERDVRIAPMDPSAMLAALQKGVIDGFATSPPFTTQAVLHGHAVMFASGLTDAPELLPFAYALLYGRPETCEQRRDTCARLVRAFTAAGTVVREQPECVLQEVLRKRFPEMGAELLRSAWDRTRRAHAGDLAIDGRHLANSQHVSVVAGLMDARDKVESYDGLYTNAFAR